MSEQGAQGGVGERLLLVEIARLRAWIMAMTFGLAGGTLLAVATAWLVVQGGDVVGPHLGLLSNYFPGYTVTWGGAVLGFFYGALLGAAAGWSLAWLYNTIANRRLSAATPGPDAGTPEPGTP